MGMRGGRVAFGAAIPTFDPGMPVATFHEPSFVFVLQTGFGTIAAFGKDHVFHTQILSQLFIGFGEEPPIRTGLSGWLVEGSKMSVQTGFPLLLITRVA